YITAEMPHVTVKIAQTMDGKAGTRSGNVKWITSDITRALARLRRDDFDAIVIGIGTVLADDPRLEATGRALVKVIVDSSLRMPLEARMLEGTKPGQVMAAVTRRASAVKRRACIKRGIGIIPCASTGGKVDLKALFKALAKNGLVRILIEGGPTLVNAVLEAGLADRLHAYIAPRLMGARPADAVDGVDLDKVLNGGGYEISSVERIGKDIFIEADHVHGNH
ncbi:MAG: RibD family protein, partial [Candidatus Omnitrophota bacterium]